MKTGHHQGVTVVLAILVCSCSAALAQSAREVAAKVSPSVVLLVMEDQNGQPLAMGSGFVVKDGVVATNLHVIEGASRGYAKLADRKEKFNITGTVAVDAARDIVLLAVEDIKAPALTIGDSKQLAVGDEVYAVGNPRGLEGTFSAGIVSSVRKVGDDSLLQITAPISPGSSGGPLVNSKGDVIGVAVATFKGGQNLNFAIPSEYLSALTRQIKAAVPLAQTGERPRDPKAKSIMEGLGGRSTDGVTAGQFLWTIPAEYSHSGIYSLSIRSQLREPVRNVVCLLVFYGNDGQPLDTAVVTFEGIIAPGLAKRVKGEVDGSVQKLTSGNAEAPRTKFEYRVLYFDLVTDDEPKEGRGDAPPVPSPDTRLAPARPAPRDEAPPTPPEDIEAVLRRGAERGDTQSMGNLGFMYARGIGVERDDREAFRWLRKAAEAGDQGAMCELGSMYKEGRGVEIDDDEAFRWLHKAAQAGHQGAMCELGLLYKAGRVRGHTVQGTRYLNLGESEREAFQWLRKASEAGNVRAMRELGLLYIRGVGVPADKRAGLKWLRKAAVLDDQYAMMLYAGDGTVSQTAHEMVEWYRKHAERGDTGAMLILGLIYGEGRLGFKDESEGVIWYRRAAEGGNAAAMCKLGHVYASGRGVAKDLRTAASWYRKSADRGNHEAMFLLSAMYKAGQGVPANNVEAYAWLSVASAMGSPLARGFLDFIELDAAGKLAAQRRSKELFDAITSSLANANKDGEREDAQ